MKNHFLISEEEKSRILNLHESVKPHHGTRLYEEETKSIDAVTKINKLKDDMQNILKYYSKNGDVVTDEESGEEVSAASNLPKYFKTKIESIRLGSEEDNQYDSIKTKIDELKGITWNNNVPVFDDYESAPKNKQVTDEYTGQHCKNKKWWESQKTYSLENRQKEGLC